MAGESSAPEPLGSPADRPHFPQGCAVRLSRRTRFASPSCMQAGRLFSPLPFVLLCSGASLAAEPPSWTRVVRETYRTEPAFAEQMTKSREAIEAIRSELKNESIILPNGARIEVAPDHRSVTLEYDDRVDRTISYRWQSFLGK